MNKPELLTWLRKEHQQWEAFLDEIGPSRMEQPGVNGDWSLKDMVGHLTGWNRWLVTRLKAAQRGEANPLPPWPAALTDVDEINAWIYQYYQPRPPQDVLEESDQVFQQLFTEIEGLPDGVAIEPEFHVLRLGDESFPAGEFFDHFHDEHEGDVRAWLAR